MVLLTYLLFLKETDYNTQEKSSPTSQSAFCFVEIISFTKLGQRMIVLKKHPRSDVH